MRRPSSGLKDDDNGCLRALTSSSSQSSSNDVTPTSNIENDENTFNSNYLPDIIDPLDWQTTRKRKDRQDSTSSITQDRKLIRSNSEEHIPLLSNESLRKTSSHEDIRPPQDFCNTNEPNEPLIVNNEQDIENNVVEEKHSFFAGIGSHHRSDTSPARCGKFDFSHSSHRSLNHHRFDDNRHEERRSTERISRTRPHPIRKSPMAVQKRSSRSSSLSLEIYPDDMKTVTHNKGDGFAKDKLLSDDNDILDALITPSDINDNRPNDLFKVDGKQTHASNETLPWSKTFQEDHVPVVCQRFADNNYDHVNHISNHMVKIRNISSSNDVKSEKIFTDLDNLNTRDGVSINTPSGSYKIHPEKRLREINKRLIVLKRKMSGYDEMYLKTRGHRPSGTEKASDKSMKHVISEINKLRKEKHSIKADPTTKISTSFDGSSETKENKIERLRETVVEIEKRLERKRENANRTENLDDMTPAELIAEKTELQKSLIYYESMFGRPENKDERDIIIGLYSRYRRLKRLVTRSTGFNSNSLTLSDLPTIMEHEALAFTAINPSSTSSAESPSDETSPSGKSELTESSSSSYGQIHENLSVLSLEELWTQHEETAKLKKKLKITIREFENSFEDGHGRKIHKHERKPIEETYMQYKQQKAKLRLLDALLKKKFST